MTSENGGTCGMASAKLILKAKANGIRKNTRRKIRGGRMISQRPGRQIGFMLGGFPGAWPLLCAINSGTVKLLTRRAQDAPIGGRQRGGPEKYLGNPGSTIRRRFAHTPAPATASDRRLHLGAAHLRPLAHHGREGRGT